MDMVYYIEVNLICIIVLLLLRNQLRRNSENHSTCSNIFSLLLWSTVVLCVSDMLAGIFRGQVFWGAKALIELSNLVFYEALAIIGYLWMVYVYISLKIIRDFDKKLFFWAIPLILFSIVAISNPLTHFLFTIDENNLFVRNSATYFHWIVTWMYIVVPTIKIASLLLREKNKNVRNDMMPFLYFIIAPTCAGVLQMLFYGITSSQVGITISLIAIFLSEQSNRILSDSLTGLNNRRSFNEYVRNHIQRHPNADLTLLMIDINEFKQINDKFGHITGDRALNDVAEVLKEVSGKAQNRLFICRYGGDEFLIATFNRSKQEIDDLKAQIHDELGKKHRTPKSPYCLKVSIGSSNGPCSDYDSVEQLLFLADKAMYDEKSCTKK